MLNNLFLSLEGMHKLFTISADDKLVLNNPTYLDYIIFIKCDDQDTALGDIFISGHEFVWAKGHLINGQDSGFGLLTLILTLQLQLTSLTERVEVLEGATHDFAIAYNLSNVTLDNMTSAISEGENYTAQIIIQEGYTLDMISVIMNGEDITQSAVVDNRISITGVTGNITISAVASAIEYSISNVLDSHVQSDNSETSAVYNSGYNANLIFDEGYTANSVQVMMGDANITDVAYKNNQINIAKVTGDVVITVESRIIEFNVIGMYTHASSDNASSTINYGESYVANLTADEHYEISSVQVTMGGANITPTAYSDGVINIDKVTGEVRINAIASIITYAVTNNLTNVTSNNSAVSANDGSEYAATLSPTEGHHFDGVEVMMGGVDITNIAYNDGQITIDSVNGAIVITASAIINTYSITNNLTRVTSSNPATSVTHGHTYFATIAAEEGYTLGSVNIMMGGVNVTSTTYSDGNINIAKVTGDIEVIASASLDTYSIVNSLVHTTSDNAATSVGHGEPYVATISSEEGYDTPSITVTMGGFNVTSQVVNGNVITIDSVTGDINITATAILKSFTITNNLTHVTNSNSGATIRYGSSYVAIISPETGYLNPNIEVTMGGYTVYVSGNEINIPSVTGDIVITAEASLIQYSITNNLSHASNNNGATTINYGESYTATISAQKNFRIDSVTCTMGGVQQTVTNNTIMIPAVTGDIVITAVASRIKYVVTYTLNESTSDNASVEVYAGDAFEANITPNEHYRITGIAVSMDGQIQNSAVTDNCINIAEVTGNIIITVSTEIITHTISNALTQCVNDNVATVINDGEAYIANITANSGYTLDTVVVTMGGVAVDGTENGVINIPSVTGNIEITAIATLRSFTITNTLVHTTSNNAAVAANNGDSYMATLTPDQYYQLGTVTVTMGGIDITNTAYSNGVIAIPSVTGDIEINAESEIITYSVASTLNESTLDNVATTIEAGSAYVTEVIPSTNYQVDSITVYMNGINVSDTVVTGNTISIDEVTGNINITVATSIIVYSITNTLTHTVTDNSAANINSGLSYTATLAVDEIGYNLTDITVTMGGIDITVTAYDADTQTITIANVTGNIEITAISTTIPDLGQVATDNVIEIFDDALTTGTYVLRYVDENNQLLDNEGDIKQFEI